MKFLLLLLIATNIVACGSSKFACGPNNCEGDQTVNPIEREEGEVINLTASKQYHPDVNQDAIVDVTELKEISLPSEISVVSGNAGNYYSLLKVDSDIVCFYKGGSDFSYPLQMGNVSEIEKGQKYHLSFCEDNDGNALNLFAGDTLIIQSSISLSIHNGDSTEDTVINLKLNVL